MSAPTDRELPPVGEVITRIREAAGFSKSEFSRQLDVTRWTVQAWERGEWPPSRENARRIAVLCGKNPGYLLQYAAWPDDTPPSPIRPTYVYQGLPHRKPATALATVTTLTTRSTPPSCRAA